jgi:hypothetical protein
MFRNSLASAGAHSRRSFAADLCSAVVNGVLTNNPVAIGVVANQIVAFQRQYQLASPLNVSTPNPNYLGTLLQQGLATGTSANMIDPNFQAPGHSR